MYFAFMYFAAYYLQNRNEGKVEVDIKRHYNNETEENLINLAESIDCDLSNVKVGSKSDIKSACITQEKIDGFLAQEQKYLAEENNKATYIREYNAWVNRNKDWPLDGNNDGVWGWFAPTILDASNTTTTAQKCLDKVDNYWLVLQRLNTVSGQPNKLAGSGADSERYIMFDDNLNLVCQYIKNESWIN